MVRFTDNQLSEIFRLTKPLAPANRDSFLQILAAELGDRSDIGDGELYRLARQVIVDHALFTAPSSFETSLRGRRRRA